MNNEELGKKLIDTALAGKHRAPELITSIPTLFAALKIQVAEKLLIRGLVKSSKQQYEDYIKYLKSGVDNVQLLINHKTFQQCIEFYIGEYKIIHHAIIEYLLYLAGGRFFPSLFGYQRPEEEMFDFITGEKLEVQTNGE